jgi:hypothetical protein
VLPPLKFHRNYINYFIFHGKNTRMEKKSDFQRDLDLPSPLTKTIRKKELERGVRRAPPLKFHKNHINYFIFHGKNTRMEKKSDFQRDLD